MGFGCTSEVCTDSRGEKGQCTVPQRLENCGKVRVRIIHGLTLVIKNSHTYCKNIISSLEAKYYYACSQGGGQQELTIARPRPSHKDRQSRINCAPTSQHNGRLYVHASGITNLNTIILTKPQSSTRTSPYYHLNITKLLQGIKFIIFSDLHESFYYIPLEYLSYQDQIHNPCKLPLLFIRLSKRYK